MKIRHVSGGEPGTVQTLRWSEDRLNLDQAGKSCRSFAGLVAIPGIFLARAVCVIVTCTVPVNPLKLIFISTKHVGSKGMEQLNNFCIFRLVFCLELENRTFCSRRLFSLETARVCWDLGEPGVRQPFALTEHLYLSRKRGPRCICKCVFHNRSNSFCRKKKKRLSFCSFRFLSVGLTVNSYPAEGRSLTTEVTSHFFWKEWVKINVIHKFVYYPATISCDG